MLKSPWTQTTFGSSAFEEFTPLWLSSEAHFQVKMLKTDMLRPLLEVEMSTKCTPQWRELEVKM